LTDIVIMFLLDRLYRCRYTKYGM